MMHPQGRCPGPTETLRVVGDPYRATYHICRECRAAYEAAPLRLTFVAVEQPRWAERRRAKEMVEA